MTDDNLRDALQGMRQPQPGSVWIKDVLAYVEPELERRDGQVRQLTEDRDRARAELEQFKPQPMSQRCRDGHHNGVGDQACLNCWCLCHNAEAESAEALAAYRGEVTRLIAQRDLARDAAVALEQENARLTEVNARLLSAASAAYGLPVDEVLAAVREEMASERGER